jgi:transcriptional regulator with XRE-family HTH domain
MAGVKKLTGPSSVRVRQNLLRLRRQRGVSAAELSRRVAELGQPILDTAIIKIEKGDRRVDVDDLVALAAALDVSPNALLLPEMPIPAPNGGTVSLTPEQDGHPRDLWAWATGELPLDRPPASRSEDDDARTLEWVFIVQNRPHRIAGSSFLRTLEYTGRLPEGVRKGLPVALGALVVAAFEAGMTTCEIRDIVETAVLAAVGTQPDKYPAEAREVINLVLQLFERISRDDQGAMPGPQSAEG